MTSPTVNFHESATTVSAEAGETILEVAQRAGVPIVSYCGGQGTCKQCKVIIREGSVQPKNPASWREETTEDGRGIRVLACQSLVTEDITVEVPLGALGVDPTVRDVDVLTGELVDLSEFSPSTPLARQFALRLSPPTHDDTLTDLDRIVQSLLAEDEQLAPLTTQLGLLQQLPAALRDNSFEVAVAITDTGVANEIRSVRPIGAADSSLGLAIDVGTSTVVAQLVDLTTGQSLGASIRRNGQIAYGEDVISRIVWTQQRDDGLARMRESIRDTLDDILTHLYAQQGIDPQQVIAASVAANTTMTSFLLGIDATTVRRTPHTPAASVLPVLTAQEVGLSTHSQAGVFCHPAVSGFVGGDITAGILATRMHRSEGLCLLVDVGTNGEIVIGNRDWLMCASCSAGPAFEGVGIEAAMAATAGAITSMHYDPKADVIKYETVNDQPPRGLCGTGLVEMIASLAETEVIDRTGTINSDFPSERVRQIGYEAEFVLLWPDESGTGEVICIRQHDLENLLRSKAAVLAGITVLLGNLGFEATDVETMYLAGTFGSSLDVEKAVAIGLLPDVPRERVRVVGNSALAGAYLTLMSSKARDEANQIVSSLTYLDLSGDAGFMDEFIASDFIPHTDLSRFPSINK
jgi:uncharacterized 2Fe-2S/4Fe-4S cluster protein (DUF4445 family)